MENKIQHALSTAVRTLLRPLVRILLRNGVAYGTFSDWVKKVYVDVAHDEFQLKGKKQTISRISILTGLTRKEVKKLQEMEENEPSHSAKRYNRAIRVISGWLNDSQFSDREGNPHPLSLEEGKQSFAELVREYSGDVPTQAMLNELLAAGSVENRNGTIHLVRRAYLPSDDPIDKIHILGTDVRELINTIDHNLTCPDDELLFQRKVSNNQLSPAALEAFRRLSTKDAQNLLEQLDRWLTEHEFDPDREGKDVRPVQVSLGIYYHEEVPKE
jgi:hypothetical protein